MIGMSCAAQAWKIVSRCAPCRPKAVFTPAAARVRTRSSPPVTWAISTLRISAIRHVNGGVATAMLHSPPPVAKLSETSPMALTNIEIAQQAKMRPIVDVARERLGIPEESLSPYGRYKAKISLDYIATLRDRPNGKLVLVTAISPTPAGEGKTTTTVGLGDALNLLGKRAMLCLREPALGPVFGAKGGAAGGGYSQVVPMEDINLHFTGDFGAIALANNLLAAAIDNHIHHGNELN